MAAFGCPFARIFGFYLLTINLLASSYALFFLKKIRGGFIFPLCGLTRYRWSMFNWV
jgi:hypothetical protein